mmetsp:Transcript_34154/g.72777  ORF Transcript_34154/g.72777 Transcript_34154/m.72777 type:complete len:237 (-) Transcript_34154:91-801(-)
MKQFAAASFHLTSFTSAAFPRNAARIINNAKGHIKRRPALTHGVVGFTLFGASDAFAQGIEASSLQEDKSSHPLSNKATEEDSSSSLLSNITFSENHFDMIRFLSAGVIGAFFGGYVYPFAYKHLDLLWEGSGFISIAKKSLLEVFTVGIFANSVSMGARGVLVGKNITEVLSHVKEEMPAITLNDLRVWFPYNMVAFGLIPIAVRPATTSLMEALWQTYISLRSNNYEKYYLDWT